MARVTPSIIISSIEEGHHFLDTKFAVFIPGCGIFRIPAVSIFLKCCIGNLQKERLAGGGAGRGRAARAGGRDQAEGIITGQANKNGTACNVLQIPGAEH